MQILKESITAPTHQYAAPLDTNHTTYSNSSLIRLATHARYRFVITDNRRPDPPIKGPNKIP